jgi:OOP family OmpA-OmpF porin
MSTTWRILLLLIAWLLYSLIGLRFCSDTVCTGCMGEAVVPGTGADDADLSTNFQRFPIDFSFSNPEPNVNAGFDSLRQSLLGQLGENGILTITGLYFENEVTPEESESMGLARAQAVRNLFAPEIPDDRIRLRARTLTTEPVNEGFFVGTEFGVEMPAPEPEEDPGLELQELADRVIFRFPYNSTEEEYNPQVEEYLADLAEELKSSGAAIRVVGHTDSKGPEDYNQRLGRNRALTISRKLADLGVPQSQIRIESKGETQPVASNDSEENRHLNRRVEIQALNE